MNDRKRTVRQVHDRGGWPTDEPIDQSERQWMDWERRTQALARVLGQKGLLVADELRRGIESIPPDQYESLSYFERWAASIETLLFEKGILTRGEIAEQVRAIEARWG